MSWKKSIAPVRLIGSYPISSTTRSAGKTSVFSRWLRCPAWLASSSEVIKSARVPRVGSPESNGMVERFNRTLKEEFFSAAHRKRLYESVEALPTDLDGFLSFYNERRAHHGYRTQGRTPLQTFTEHQRAAEAPQAA